MIGTLYKSCHKKIIHKYLDLKMTSIGSLSLEHRVSILMRVTSFLPEETQVFKKVCKAWEEVFNQTILNVILGLPLDLRTPVLSRVVPYLTLKENALVVRVSKRWEEAAQTTRTKNLYLFGRLQSCSSVSFFGNSPFLPIQERTFRYLDPTGKELGCYLEKRLSAEKSKREAFDFLKNLTPEQREYIQTLELLSFCLRDVEDDDVSHFLTLCPNVRFLSLNSTVATGAFLSHFKGNLIKLTFLGNQIDEDEIKGCVKANPELIELMIVSENISGRFLEELSDLSKLKVFSFRSNQAQDSFLNQVSKMSSLESLCVISNQVSGSFLKSVPVSLKKLRLESEQLKDLYLSLVFLKCPYLELLDIHSNSLQGSFLSVLSSTNQIKQLSLQGVSFLNCYLREGINKCRLLERLQVFSSGASVFR